MRLPERAIYGLHVCCRLKKKYAFEHPLLFWIPLYINWIVFIYFLLFILFVLVMTKIAQKNFHCSTKPGEFIASMMLTGKKVGLRSQFKSEILHSLIYLSRCPTRRLRRNLFSLRIKVLPVYPLKVTGITFKCLAKDTLTQQANVLACSPYYTFNVERQARKL